MGTATVAHSMDGPGAVDLTVVRGGPTVDAQAVAALLERALPGPRPGVVCAPEVIGSLSVTGNLVAVASIGVAPVGAAIGLLVHEGTLSARLELVAVDPEHRGRGVGRALFEEALAWAREAGAEQLTWTFDPLSESDALLSLHVIGAEVVGYVPPGATTIGDARCGGRPGHRLLVAVDPASTSPRGSRRFAPIVTLRIPGADDPPEKLQTFVNRLRDLVARGHPLDVDGDGRYLVGTASEPGL